MNGSVRMLSHDMTGTWDSPSDHDGFFPTSSHLSGASPGRSHPPPPSCGTSDSSAHNAGARSSPETPRFFLEKPDAFSSACQSSHASILDRYIRAKTAEKRAGTWERIVFEDNLVPSGTACTDLSRLLDVDRLLDRLAEEGPRKASVVEMRFFGGLEFAEITEQLKASLVTIKRDWKFCRAWLFKALTEMGTT